MHPGIANSSKGRTEKEPVYVKTLGERSSALKKLTIAWLREGEVPGEERAGAFQYSHRRERAADGGQRVGTQRLTGTKGK